MSQSNSTDDEFEQYRGTAGAEVKTANISSDDNVLKQAIGTDDGAKERIYDPKLAGERFVQFYDDSAAAIREYLSNAETACIRRAKAELRDLGYSDDEIPTQVSKLLDMAKEEAGYEPLIEVTYNRKPDATRLIIEDNGIGISTEEYQVVQRVGYSTSHDSGERLGNFGMGWMSGFQLTSVNGVFKMKTKSYLTDEAYGTAEYVANFEYLDASPDDYGTRFEFPGFGEEAKSINIPKKVNEYTEGMVVPVLYRDFDESGNETNHSDDFLPHRLEEDYPDDSVVVIYENEFFKAVMSPDKPENRSSTVTYNISMPIRRNTDAFGRRNKFGTQWHWDYRGKQENGPIVSCPSDESIVGLSPKEDSKYDRLSDNLRDKCIPMSEVPDDAIVMPEPASSRDSFKSGHDDFWKYVGEKLNEKWAEVAKQSFVGLDSWDDAMDMSRTEKEKLFRAYNHYGPSYSDADPDTIQETLEDTFDLTIDKDLCKKIHKSQSFVNIVRRGHSRAHTKNATSSKRIWKVISESPDGVYMGKTISQKKAEIVWGLGETHLVRLKDNQTYDELENDWGWTKAKELPNRNLKEKLPELDDDVAEKFENTDAGDSNNTRGSTKTGGNGKDPETYQLKARYSTGSRRYFTAHRADNLKEKLEDGDDFRGGRTGMKYLVIRPDDESARQTARHANRSNGVAATRLPKYVYNYFKGTNNVYESYDEVQEENGGCEVTLSDGTTACLTELDDTDCIFIVDRRTEDHFEDKPERLLELLKEEKGYGPEPDSIERYTFLKPSDISNTWGCSTDANILVTETVKCNLFADYTFVGIGFRSLYRQDVLEGLDEDSDEYDALFGYRHGRPNSDQFETLVEIAQDAGLVNQ